MIPLFADANADVPIDRVIAIIGLIALPTFIWWQQRRDKKMKADAEKKARVKEEEERHQKALLDEAVLKAREEGAEAARGDAQRAATKAIHDRLSKYGRRLVKLEGRVDTDREFLIRKHVIPAGSQVGEEGTGVRNPYLNPTADELDEDDLNDEDKDG